MSINNELKTTQQAISDIKDAIETKGGTVGNNISSLAPAILSLKGGADVEGEAPIEVTTEDDVATVTLKTDDSLNVTEDGELSVKTYIEDKFKVIEDLLDEINGTSLIALIDEINGEVI